MLKPLAVAAVILLASVGLAGSSRSSLENPALIRVSAVIATENDDGSVEGYWIHDRHATRIGWAIIVCDDLGGGGPLGSGTAYCEGTFLFPKGRIQASSTRKNRSSYVLAVTGGTGLYSNVGGTLLIETVSEHPRTVRLLFSLEP